MSTAYRFAAHRPEAHLEANDAYVTPTSGLFGSVSIVDVAEGTFYAYNADAIEGFTYVPLIAQTGEAPTLASANDRNSTLTATSHVFADGESLTSIFPQSRAIDAVSSLFAADNIYNEYVVHTEWCDRDRFGADFPHQALLRRPAVRHERHPTFRASFRCGRKRQRSGPVLRVGSQSQPAYDREENLVYPTVCGFNECPPQPSPSLCLETNVLRFGATSILGSQLPAQGFPSLPQGFVRLDLAGSGHDMNPANNGTRPSMACRSPGSPQQSSSTTSFPSSQRRQCAGELHRGVSPPRDDPLHK